MLHPLITRAAAAALACSALAAPAIAQVGDDAIIDAREALKKNDRARLVSLRDRSAAARHPLAMWPDYWELSSRLEKATVAEVDAFLERWNGTYVEDRLRNDFLLELGRRRDWATFARLHPAYRMQDDREVACYALLLQHQAGQDVKEAALAAWYAQRDADDGCSLLAITLAEQQKLRPGEIWHEARLSVDANRLRPARLAVGLIGRASAQALGEVLEHPARFLKRRLVEPSALQQELATLALLRLASTDPEAAASELDGAWGRALDDDQAAYAWASVGRHAALRLNERAHDYFQQAWRRQRAHGPMPRWTDDTLAWSVRAALRTSRIDRERWGAVLQAIDLMSPTELRDPAWTYWKARALRARARSDAERDAARLLLEGLAAGVGYHAQLAAHDLGRMPGLPAPVAGPTEAERDAASRHPGLQRGLRMAQIGLRDEGRREWNYSLRGLSDRELLAAAQQACSAQDWQLCINTSERSKDLVDLQQRYPMPWQDTIIARATERGLDPALVFGLIRQETRFIANLRSSAGATGLMQLMPATARWTARKVGLELRPELVTDVDVNLRLGTTYLKLLLDDFAGSQAMAAAAYNAGPGRPRRWREGPVVDAATWTENIPFNETRDYVKKVLGNAVVYAQLLGAAPMSLRSRLGQTIGPREASAPPADSTLP